MTKPTQSENFVEQIRREHDELRELLGNVSRTLAKRLETVAHVSEMLASLCDHVGALLAEFAVKFVEGLRAASFHVFKSFSDCRNSVSVLLLATPRLQQFFRRFVFAAIDQLIGEKPMKYFRFGGAFNRHCFLQQQSYHDSQSWAMLMSDENRFTPIKANGRAQLDLIESENGFEVTVDLPGLKCEDVNVELKDGNLWITGETKEEKEEEGKTYHRIERRQGQFRRVLPLPANVKDDEVEAKFTDGVLKIMVPKSEEAKTKHIEIKS